MTYGPSVDEAQKRLVWTVLNTVAAAISVVVTRRVLSAVWRRFGGGPPPEGPADRKVTLGAALAWAVSMGVGVGVARLIAVRLSARVWEAATHEAPPDATSPL
jgi:hypothetical protein